MDYWTPEQVETIEQDIYNSVVEFITEDLATEEYVRNQNELVLQDSKDYTDQQIESLDIDSQAIENHNTSEDAHPFLINKIDNSLGNILAILQTI